MFAKRIDAFVMRLENLVPLEVKNHHYHYCNKRKPINNPPVRRFNSLTIPQSNSPAILQSNDPTVPQFNNSTIQLSTAHPQAKKRKVIFDRINGVQIPQVSGQFH